VRADRVVHLATPPVHILIEVLDRVPPHVRPHLGLERPVEPLDLPLRLGVVRPAVAGGDPQPDQPRLEPRHAGDLRARAAEAVIAEHPLR
jgi:hypothetical protein